MLITFRLLTLVILMLIFNVVWAEADSRSYLAVLDAEASSLYPDQKTVIQENSSGPDQKMLRQEFTEKLSEGSFMSFMKKEYPASYRVYQQMPVHYQIQVFSSYQLHLDIDKSRQEMLKMLRNN